ncbi:MAG: L-rhamnose mutarotase [Bacteroidaceae bacterium]|nr:L-rhamnose mutarotase [Bacteroidaceae bacterium]
MNGYIQKKIEGRTKRYVQLLELKDDPEKIREYKKWHTQEHHWKEIRDGIREVGILEMEIYIRGTQLVMIVDTPEDFDWQTAMDKLATLPRQAEWEAFVARLQGCREDARSDEKWQMTERMFYLYD